MTGYVRFSSNYLTGKLHIILLVLFHMTGRARPFMSRVPEVPTLLTRFLEILNKKVQFSRNFVKKIAKKLCGFTSHVKINMTGKPYITSHFMSGHPDRN